MKPLLGLLLLVAPLAALAQEGRNVSRVYAIRADLQDQLNRLELAASSPAYSLTLRQQARFEAELVRRRLDEGDFQVGDRILLSVENEPVLSDTFTVDVVSAPPVPGTTTWGLVALGVLLAGAALVSRRRSRAQPAPVP